MLLRARTQKSPSDVIQAMRQDMARLRDDVGSLRVALTRSGRKSVKNLTHRATDRATDALHTTGRFVRERPVLTMAGSTFSVLGIISVLGLVATIAGLMYAYAKR